jgi:hypothetical protein
VQLSPKELAIEDAFRMTRTNGVKGHYLEFGVFQGKTSSVAAYLLRRYGMDEVHLYLFDSFQGMPAYAVPPFHAGQYATSRAVVERNIRQSGIAPSRVHLVEGYFEDSLCPPLAEAIGAAAVIYVDCDLYRSTQLVLEFVTPLIQDGTVIIFDDWWLWHSRPDEGEQRAFHEWRALNPTIEVVPYRSVGHHGEAFLLRRRR